MKKEGKIKVLFHHGDFPDDFESHDYFGSGGFLHKYLENRVGREIKWHFVGGYISIIHILGSDK